MPEVGGYPNATVLTGSERLVGDQGLVTKNVTPVQIASFILSPQWVKVASSLTYAGFATPALNQSIPLFTLLAGGVIHGIKIKHGAPFKGGALSAYTLSVGIASIPDKYASAFNVFQAVGSNVIQISQTFGTEDNVLTTSILVTARSVGGNLDAATTGVTDIWALLSVAL